MSLVNNRLYDIFQYLIYVPDVLRSVMMCALVFCHKKTSLRASLKVSSPPAFSVHQDDTVISAAFFGYFGTFWHWFMLAWEPASLY